MARSMPVAAIVVGLAALVMVLVRAASGNWMMPSIVLTGVIGAAVTFGAWWLWDRRVFGRALDRLGASGQWDAVIGGYLVAAQYRNQHAPRPRLGEVVVAVGPSGVSLFDPRERAERPVLVTDWSDIIDLVGGSGRFLGEDRPGLVISTMEGRITVVLRTNEKLGIITAGGAQTDELVQRLRRLRPNAHFE